MSRPELYPWQQEAWRTVAAIRSRLPHSLLIHGLPGTGKALFASELASSLLCLTPTADGRACDDCKSCRLLAAGSHPDLSIVRPEEEATAIVVDQIRAVISFLSLRPHTSPQKVVLIGPAEKMNINASNSLLKALEEPPADSLVILYSHAPGALPATIRSRCSRIRIDTPPVVQGEQWLVDHGLEPALAHDLLAAANGAPLQALAMAEQGFLQTRQMMMQDLLQLRGPGGDPVSCAAKWKSAGTRSCLQWLTSLIADMVQLSMTSGKTIRLNNPSLERAISELAAKSRLASLLSLLDSTVEAVRLSDTPLDDTLLIEDILIRWSKTAVN